jgi:t-SNARE complex subunit (syntaxin)
VEEQNLKSPLPPRRIKNEEVEEESKIASPVEQRTTNLEEVENGGEKTIEKKKIDIKKISIFGGIAIAIILLVMIIVSLSGKGGEEKVVTLNY